MTNLSAPPPITAARARSLYYLSLVGAALVAVLVVAIGLRQSTVAGIEALIVALAVLFVLFGWLRLGLENALALIRMADTLSEIAEHEAVIAVNTTTHGSRHGSDASGVRANDKSLP